MVLLFDKCSAPDNGWLNCRRQVEPHFNQNLNPHFVYLVITGGAKGQPEFISHFVFLVAITGGTPRIYTLMWCICWYQVEPQHNQNLYLHVVYLVTTGGATSHPESISPCCVFGDNRWIHSTTRIYVVYLVAVAHGICEYTFINLADQLFTKMTPFSHHLCVLCQH